MTRRAVLLASLALPSILVACDGVSGGPSFPPPQELEVQHRGRGVRCLVHQVGAGDDPTGTMGLVLLHGANANADQWTNIGLIDAMQHLVLSGRVRSVVAIAPDIADHSLATSLVVDAVFPELARRYMPAALSISGISLGGRAAFSVAEATGDQLVSVGLHSPALQLRQAVARRNWKCWIDVGAEDSLRFEGEQTANSLRASGIDVTSHQWAGRHDRKYWRAHLPAYLAFHVDAVEARTG